MGNAGALQWLATRYNSEVTQPLGQGTSTWARTTQFADLEWGMSRKKVLAHFAAAKSLSTKIVALPSEAPPIAGLHVYASVAFDDTDHVASITLKSESPRPADATDALLLQAANKVMAALDIPALAALPAKPTSWKHKGTQITFERDDDCFWFELAPA
jgi:hypothetical protein